jgi:hypothetical protein
MFVQLELVGCQVFVTIVMPGPRIRLVTSLIIRIGIILVS